MSLFRPRVLAAALAFTASSAFAHTNERGLDPQNFDEAVGACVCVRETIAPEPEWMAVYAEGHERFRALYPALRTS